MPATYPYRYETRLIASQTDLRAMAKKLKISYGSLLDMNPELQRGMTPPGKHALRVPAAIAQSTDSNQEPSTVTNNQ
jgi:hypothetical protein